MADADPYLDALVSTVTADPNALGLVLCGSSADADRRDRWSDHDFLLVTVDGTPETYRTDLSWLPDASSLAWSFRDTPHGVKALYRDGLLVEFAVFDRAEFAGCALNHASVVVDCGGIAELAEEVRARSLAPRPIDPVAEFRAFLALLYIGTGRAHRGERLSANVFLRTYAVEHLLRLAQEVLPESRRRDLDRLDPWRRFETADALFAAELDAAMALPVTEVGRALLAAAQTWLAPLWPDYPHADTAIVRRLLGW